MWYFKRRTLLKALRRYELEKVKTLAADIDVNRPLRRGHRLIHFVCEHQWPYVLQYLVLERGADVNVETRNRWTPIQLVGYYGDRRGVLTDKARKMIQFLKAHGAKRLRCPCCQVRLDPTLDDTVEHTCKRCRNRIPAWTDDRSHEML